MNARSPSAVGRRGSVVLLAVTVVALCRPLAAAAQPSPEAMALYVARARELARESLIDAAAPVGVLLLGGGPTSAAASPRRGLGHGTLSVGARAVEFRVTNPDYTVADPAGADAVDGYIGAVYADLGLGLLNLDRGPRVTVLGSVDLLLRYGLTVGDQADIADRIDFGKLKSLFGAGLRLGLLAGRGVPTVSFSAGVNHLQERTFQAQGDIVEDDTRVPFAVALEFAETNYYALLEISAAWLGVVPYVAGGLTRHHLDARYAAVVVFDVDATEQPPTAGTIDLWESQGVVYGGLAIGRRVGLVLEAGAAGDQGFASIYLQFHR